MLAETSARKFPSCETQEMVTDRKRKRLTATKYTAIVLARTVVAVAIILGLYALVPIDKGDSDQTVLIVMTVLGVIWLLAVARQLVRLRRSQNPILQVGEALATVVVLLVVCFALTAMMIDSAPGNQYSENLDKTAAFYYSMTVTTTVGFGDITPTSHLARNVADVQMFVDLVALAAALRALTWAVQPSSKRSNRRSQPSAESADAGESKTA